MSQTFLTIQPLQKSEVVYTNEQELVLFVECGFWTFKTTFCFKKNYIENLLF